MWSLPSFLRLRASRAIVSKSGYFDAIFYLTTYPDVAQSGIDPLKHYLTDGYREGRRPFAAFDSQAYLAENPDVRDAGVDPLIHWLRNGAKEGRKCPIRQAAYAPRGDAEFLQSVFYPLSTFGEGK